MASFTSRRRNALIQKDLVNLIPLSVTTKNDLAGQRGENYIKQMQPDRPTDRGHTRHDAMDWSAFNEALTSTTTSFYPTSPVNSSHPPVPSSSRRANHVIEISREENSTPSPSINELITQLSSTSLKHRRDGELSSLEYSDSSSDESSEGSVSDDVELAILKSVYYGSTAVTLDFSLMEKTSDEFQCAICLEQPINLDSLATVSGCEHHFCFDVSGLQHVSKSLYSSNSLTSFLCHFSALTHGRPKSKHVHCASDPFILLPLVLK